MPIDDEPLIGFYRSGRRNPQGRTLDEILAWSDAMLEAVHDYIQWLFPLPEPSSANRSAPRLTPEVQEAFVQSVEMRVNLRAAWVRMLRFYGFAPHPDGSVVRGQNYKTCAANWLTPYNHNHLRLTRMLRSLHLLGLEQESAALFLALTKVYEEDELASRNGGGGRHSISRETFGYWERATR